jgi:hypothetical protein
MNGAAFTIIGSSSIAAKPGMSALAFASDP